MAYSTPHFRPRTLPSLLVSTFAVLGISACSTAPTAAPSATAPNPAAAKPSDPAALKPFADVIKDAKQQDGLFPIWRKDDKVWLEIPQSALNKPFLFSANIANSVGERGLYASQMGNSWMAEWRRTGNGQKGGNGNQLQLIALNTKFRAEGGAENGAKRAVAQAFSPSLIASAAVLSQEHPERRSVLIDASFLLADIPSYSTRIEAAYRLSYTLDKATSFIESTRASNNLSTLTARVHFSTPRIPAPPLTPPPIPTPTPPQSTPDPRSFFVSYVYNFLALPETPMRPRPSDPRLGHFMESFTDLSGDSKPNPKVHFIKRWRLEQEQGKPIQPIVYWLDKNIPEKYRAAVRVGVLEWNKAFARIGFPNAIEVRDQPADADWDTLDAGHASIRWFVGADVGFAVGPHHADPRTGEILDADIGMSDVFARSSRRFIVEDAKNPSHHAHDACTYAAEAASEMHFALDMLEARGDIEPNSPEAEAFVQSVITDVIMHEVGHTLGLKHNFKASTTITQAQLQDLDFTQKYGISGSVMDYNAYNLALQGEQQGAYTNQTLGAYDYWAIEYAYKPLPSLTPEAEKAELAAIAARSTEPALAYADDSDAGGFGGSEGIDPLANRFDLGDDPLAYYRKRLKLSQELWERIQNRKPQAGDDPLRQRRSLLAGFSQLQRAAELVGKYVGGMIAVRDLPGTTSRASFTPVEPAKQREALQFLATGLFSADSFRFKPEFLSHLTVDYNEWERGGLVDLRSAVLRTQTTAMDRLLAAGTAQRLLDLPNYLPPQQQKGMISLNEVYKTLQSSIWKELATGSEIDALRRNLQREHLKRLQTILTKGSSALPSDALSLLRLHATHLQKDLQQALHGKNAKKIPHSIETRAHLAESLGILTEALRATMQRS